MSDGIKLTFLPFPSLRTTNRWVREVGETLWNSSYSQVEWIKVSVWAHNCPNPSSLPFHLHYHRLFGLLYIYSCRVNDTHLVTLRMPRCSMTWSERARSRPREFANKKPSRMAGSGWFNVKGPYISEIRWSSLLVIPPMMFLCLFCGSASRLQVMFFLATKFQMRKKPGDWTINAPFRLGRGFLHRPLTLGCKLQANIVTNIIYWVRAC